jgi:hypothetical protein
MFEWNGLGKMFLLVGGILVFVGALLTIIGKPTSLDSGFGWFGKLPGDIIIKRDNFSLFFPLTTSLLISVVVSLMLYLLSLLKR